jgi:PncC family amidohydrolase
MDWCMTSDLLMVLNKVHKQLLARQQTVSVAESCTGGLVGAVLTEQPGSSKYFLGGIQAYANAMKTDLLSVRRETLLSFGAVSEEVASEMALSIRRFSGSDWAISTTGIAGPDGGSEDKPVGTVWISVAGSEDVFSQKLTLDGERSAVRHGTVLAALTLLLEHLIDDDTDL